jgi:hypothetical protein
MTMYAFGMKPLRYFTVYNIRNGDEILLYNVRKRIVLNQKFNVIICHKINRK